MEKRFIVFVLCFVLFLNTKVNAQQIETDRPDQTEASSTVGKYDLQIETGTILEYSGENLTAERRFVGPTSLIRFGLFKGIELRLVNQFESISNNFGKYDGLSDLELGTKIQLFHRESSPHEIAFLSHVVLPTGSLDITSNTYGTVNKLLISHKLSDMLTLGYNLGYSNFDTPKGDLTYSMALGFSINEKVGLYFEGYGIYEEMKDFQANFDGGFTYLIQDNLQLDFSFGTGITQRMNYISVGISWLMRHE